LPPLKTGKPQSSRLAGEYYCPELDTTYAVRPNGKNLKLVFKASDPLELIQIKHGLFKAGFSLTLQVDKPGRGKFTLCAGRVKNLVFARK
jgi:hypothetical protein